MTTNSNLIFFSGCERELRISLICDHHRSREPVNTLSQSTINAAKNDIYNLINTTTLPRGKRLMFHPISGGFVRLAFHDCVGDAMDALITTIEITLGCLVTRACLIRSVINTLKKCHERTAGCWQQ